MAFIEETFGKTIIYELTKMKEIHPELPGTEISQKLDEFAERIETEFRKLLHG